MTTLNADSERLIQEAIKLALQAIDSRRKVDKEERKTDKRDTTAVYEELYSDDDHDLDPRQIARNWHDAQDRAQQATAQLEEMDTNARWEVDDLMSVLLDLEESVKSSNPELHKDLQYARCRCFQPDMEDIGYYWELDRRLERLIEYLGDLSNPDERAARQQLISWSQQHPDLVPWGRTNQQLRDFLFHVGSLSL